MADKTPAAPSPLEVAEQAVIGALLIDARCVGDVLAAVQEDYFIGAPYRRLYLAVRALFGAGEPVDVVTVLDKAGQDLRELAMGCMDVTPTAANVLHYCSILREQSALERLRILSSRLYGAEGLADAEDIIAEAARVISARPGVEVLTINDLMADLLQRLSSPAPEYVSWGIPMLDSALHTDRGSYVLIGGRPSAGKTAFALQLGLDIAKTKRVGFISLETSKERAADRIAAASLPVTLPDIKARKIDPAVMQQIAATLGGGDLTKRQFFFLPASSMTVDEVKSVALSNRLDVIIIDYVQLLRPTVRGDRQEQMQDVSIQLRAFAQLTGVVVVALAQLRRAERGSEKKAPTMADLKESGQFEQDADAILLLYLEDPDEKDGPRRLKIDKNKDGPAGFFRRFAFDGRRQRFTMLEEPGPAAPRSPFRDIDDNTQLQMPGEWTRPHPRPM